MNITLRNTLGLFLAAVVICSWFSPMDWPATQQVEAGLKRAAISYGSARSINALISAAQGTEISLAPAGLGVILTPGQALEPFNDMVKDFANLMLAASVSFGVQKVLISVGAYWLISLVLTIATIGLASFYFRQQQPPAWLSRVLVILLMVRFAVPLVTIGTDQVFQKFLAADYETHQKAIETLPAQIDQLNPAVQTPLEKQGMVDQMRHWWNQDSDVKAHYEQLRQAGEQWIEHFIKLIVIFLLQTLVIPLLFLWVLYVVVRSAFALPRSSVH